MRGTKMLRFESEAELNATKRANRERFAAGKIHTPEKDILAGGLELLKKHPKVKIAFRMNTGAGYVLRADVFHRLVAAGHLKRDEARYMQFGFKGAPDGIGILAGGRALFAEAKSDTGKLSDDQAAVLDAVNAAGGLGVVFRSVDELAKALE